MILVNQMRPRRLLCGEVTTSAATRAVGPTPRARAAQACLRQPGRAVPTASPGHTIAGPSSPDLEARENDLPEVPE